jgi:hypothetical protein
MAPTIKAHNKHAHSLQNNSFSKNHGIFNAYLTFISGIDGVFKIRKVKRLLNDASEEQIKKKMFVEEVLSLGTFYVWAKMQLLKPFVSGKLASELANTETTSS